jgi:hypothetical protein
MNKHRFCGLNGLWCGLFSVWIVVFQPVHAQYNFTEMGFRLGGGTNLPLLESTLKTGAAWNVDGFFTHFRCGKRDGFHFDVGVRGFSISEQIQAGDISLLYPERFERTTYTFGFAELGANYKIRATKHNTLKEVAFMIGPKVNFRLWSVASPEGVAANRLSPNTLRSVPLVNPGLHMALHIRRMLTKFHYLFIIPGAEYYFLPTVNLQPEDGISATPGFNSLYLFLNVGLTFRLKQTF